MGSISKGRLVMNRTCNKCGQTKDLELFVRDKRKPYGRGYVCKDCKRQVSALARSDAPHESVGIKLPTSGETPVGEAETPVTPGVSTGVTPGVTDGVSDILAGMSRNEWLGIFFKNRFRKPIPWNLPFGHEYRTNQVIALSSLVRYPGAIIDMTAAGIIPHAHTMKCVLCQEQATTYQWWGNGALDVAPVCGKHEEVSWRSGILWAAENIFLININEIREVENE